jgi:preprotein translocase subunit SecG
MKIAFIVLYLVVTIAMIAFIMLQRGSGAAAGSGFGSGASGTVFGARGSSNFLSKATKWLAVAFFLLALGMGVYEARVGITKDPQADLGVMGQLPDTTTSPASEVPSAGNEGAVPAAGTEIPTAPAAATEAPTEVPAAAESSSQTSETAAENASKEDEKPQ